MTEDKKYWLNEFGERYWYKKSDITITAHRSYHWLNRITFIKEGSVHYVEDKGIWSTGDRRHIGETTYTKFKEEEDNWVPIQSFWKYAEELKYEYDYIRKYNL